MKPLYELTRKWYVVYTQSRHEALVEAQLKEKGIEAFLPRILERSRRKDRCLTIEKPLFPGYLFNYIEPTRHQFLKILKCRGVVYFLGNENGPQEVPSDRVESIQILMKGKRAVESSQYLNIGDYVHVVSGSLRGATGRLKLLKEGGRKLVVSIDIFQRSIAVDLDEKDIVVAKIN